MCGTQLRCLVILKEREKTFSPCHMVPSITVLFYGFDSQFHSLEIFCLASGQISWYRWWLLPNTGKVFKDLEEDWKSLGIYSFLFRKKNYKWLIKIRSVNSGETCMGRRKLLESSENVVRCHCTFVVGGMIVPLWRKGEVAKNFAAVIYVI